MRRLIRIFVIAALCLPTAALAHGVSEADREVMVSGGLVDYVRLGALHMVTGYDHLLFLFGVIFFLTRARDVVKFVTAFTLGHSITLLFATLLGVRMNYYLIDAVIALSVCYKGFENLDGFRKWLNTKSPNLLAVVFAFGLIHGFGLSTRLQQLPLGKSGLAPKILAFNVGVELGQVAALLGMVALLAAWRRRPSFQQFALAANAALVVVGFLLLTLQLHSYQHLRYQGEFGFNHDAHYHLHERWMQTNSGPRATMEGSDLGQSVSRVQTR